MASKIDIWVCHWCECRYDTKEDAEKCEEGHRNLQGKQFTQHFDCGTSKYPNRIVFDFDGKELWYVRSKEPGEKD